MGARTMQAAAGALLVALAGAATPAGAFTMAEQVATTGVQGTLARTSAPGAARTIGSVKSKLATSAPTAPSLSSAGAGRPGAQRPGATGGGRKARSSGGCGWGDATQGWAKSGAASGKGGGSWVSSGGGWAESADWPGDGSKTWADQGSGGGGWAKPGKKG